LGELVVGPWLAAGAPAPLAAGAAALGAAALGAGAAFLGAGLSSAAAMQHPKKRTATVPAMYRIGKVLRAKNAFIRFPF
jgi:hypothetical protein